MGPVTILPPRAFRPTPVWATVAFTFLCSIGTGLVTNGVYYLTETAYGFSRAQNLALAFVMGITYIFGARTAGRAVRRLRAAFPILSSRAVLALLMVVMALICLIPAFATPAKSGGEGGEGGGERMGVWVIWVVVLTYTPLTGVLWPMVESFVSGGRSGKNLRSVISLWNAVWSSAIIFAYLVLSALVKRDPALSFQLLAGVHVLCAVLLVSFQREPAPHLDEHHQPHPPLYSRLLVVFRMLLPAAYFVLSALNPILPNLMASIGVAEQWRPILATSWLIPRAVMFVVLARWQGWHGTWSTPIVGTGLLLAGFALAVLSPLLGATTIAVVMMATGLAIFGAGLSLIYSGALYYAMEVGKADVDAGGTHEALIGVGYTTGPACGLIAAGAIASGVAGPSWFELIVLTIVGAAALLIGAYAVRHSRRQAALDRAGA